MMKFEKGYLYHVYNQGNNKRKIFYNRRNYFFFKDKIKTHILPFADVIAWCLMPNHFHLLIYVKHEKILINKSSKFRSINDSIGVMLRSYTRAINLQENTSGSLFRKETKSICLNKNNENYSNFFSEIYGTRINLTDSNIQYPQVCFNYIHSNPIDAKLVVNLIQWEFSSFREYSYNQQELVNLNRAKEYIDLNEFNL